MGEVEDPEWLLEKAEMVAKVGNTDIIHSPEGSGKEHILAVAESRVSVELTDEELENLREVLSEYDR